MGLFEDNLAYYQSIGYTGASAENDARRNAEEGRSVGTARGSRPGTQSSTVGSGSSLVNIPEFVDFDAGAILSTALADANAQGTSNINRFLDNFDISEDIADSLIQSELKGLKTFLPETTSLIRAADQDTNENTLQQTGVFNFRNQQATQSATAANTKQRADLVDQEAPGVRSAVEESLKRSEGDVQRIRERESTPLVSEALKTVAARSARLRGADVGAAGGFGVTSGTTRAFIDRFDLDKRIELDSLERADARAGDAAILSGENAVQNAATVGANLYNSLIAPGIVDFNPLQPAPTVTNIGGQINPNPTVDAGTLRRQTTNDLTNLSTISPTTVFGTSVDLQDKQLTFEQDINNTIAGAQNQSADLARNEEILAQERLAFEQSKDEKASADRIRNLVSTGVITASAGRALLDSLGITGDDILDALGNPLGFGLNENHEKYPDHTGHLDITSDELSQYPGYEVLERKEGDRITIGRPRGALDRSINNDTATNTYKDYSKYTEAQATEEIKGLIGDSPPAIQDLTYKELISFRSGNNPKFHPKLIASEIERRSRIRELMEKGGVYEYKKDGVTTIESSAKYTDPNSDYISYGGTNRLSKRDSVITFDSGQSADGSSQGSFAGAGGGFSGSNLGGSFNNSITGTSFDPNAEDINQEERETRYEALADVHINAINDDLRKPLGETGISAWDNTRFPEPTFNNPYPTGVDYSQGFRVIDSGWEYIGATAYPNSNGQFGSIYQYRGETK